MPRLRLHGRHAGQPKQQTPAAHRGSKHPDEGPEPANEESDPGAMDQTLQHTIIWLFLDWKSSGTRSAASKEHQHEFKTATAQESKRYRLCWECRWGWPITTTPSGTVHPPNCRWCSRQGEVLDTDHSGAPDYYFWLQTWQTLQKTEADARWERARRREPEGSYEGILREMEWGDIYWAGTTGPASQTADQAQFERQMRRDMDNLDARAAADRASQREWEDSFWRIPATQRRREPDPGSNLGPSGPG